MDWEKVIAELERRANSAINGGRYEPQTYQALTAVLDALKSGLESAQEAQSPAEDQPDP